MYNNFMILERHHFFDEFKESKIVRIHLVENQDYYQCRSLKKNVQIFMQTSKDLLFASCRL